MTNAQTVMTANYSSPTGRTYFFVTCPSAAAMANYATIKSVIATAPSPTAASTEFAAAGPFYQELANDPTPLTRLAQLGYRFMFGITPWKSAGNQPAITAILSAYGNLIGEAAETGLSDSILYKGYTMDGKQASWWYGIDWFQIQVKQALAAAIVLGSNEYPPLDYDQNGIDRLTTVAEEVLLAAIRCGCARSGVISAIPYGKYKIANPGDVSAGIYNAFSATIAGPNGFSTITFAIDAVQF